MIDFAVLRQHMVDNQLRTGSVTDREVLRAFLAVPREPFVAPAERPLAYADREVRMADGSPGRRMMQPVFLARLMMALPLGPEAKVMVVGCGSGYSAALLGRLAGSVVAVEEDKLLAGLARDRLRDLTISNVSVHEAALTEGYPAGAPYDGILIEGGVERVPEPLIRQLRDGGIVATIERDDRVSRAVLYERVGDDATKWPQFDAWATLLPGFQRERAFAF